LISNIFRSIEIYWLVLKNQEEVMKNFYKKTLYFILLTSNLCLANFQDKLLLNKLFLKAAATNQIDILKYTLEAGADINATDQYGYSALFIATYGRHENCLEFLLAKGADAKKRGPFEETLLIVAASKKDKIFDLIFSKKNKKSINAKNKKGLTALMIAARYNAPEVVKILLATGAKTNCSNSAGETALMIAEEEDFYECAHLIRQHIAGKRERSKSFSKSLSQGRLALASPIFLL